MTIDQLLADIEAMPLSLIAMTTRDLKRLALVIRVADEMVKPFENMCISLIEDGKYTTADRYWHVLKIYRKARNGDVFASGTSSGV